MQSPGDKGQCSTQGELGCWRRTGLLCPPSRTTASAHIFCSLQLRVFITKTPGDQLSCASPHLREFTPQPLHFAGGSGRRGEPCSKAHELLVLLLPLLTGWLGDLGQETPFFYLKTQVFLPYLRKKKKKL